MSSFMARSKEPFAARINIVPTFVLVLLSSFSFSVNRIIF